ncbi:unnamed protein product [Orchesella dallaii]|uniref:Uncharacterized protein n=1 Tax=Orchesella dallaii TaxID=48710 RepID=A0ABP1S3Z4_9HEXA
MSQPSDVMETFSGLNDEDLNMSNIAEQLQAQVCFALDRFAEIGISGRHGRHDRHESVATNVGVSNNNGGDSDAAIEAGHSNTQSFEDDDKNVASQFSKIV